MPDVTICSDSVTDSANMQINPVCEQEVKLNVEHAIIIHGVKQFASELCKQIIGANGTCDVSDKPRFECGANLFMYSVGRVATDKFGCRVIRRPFVGVLSNEDAVLRVAGSAKTVSQPILPVQKTARPNRRRQQLGTIRRSGNTIGPERLSLFRQSFHARGGVDISLVSLGIFLIPCGRSCSCVVCACALATDRDLDCGYQAS